MTSFLVYAALTTPFADDGSVDVEAVSSHVELLVDDGVEGLVAAGTTGEGPLLEEHEVTSVVAAAVEAAAGRMEVIATWGGRPQRPRSGSPPTRGAPARMR